MTIAPRIIIIATLMLASSSSHTPPRANDETPDDDEASATRDPPRELTSREKGVLRRDAIAAALRGCRPASSSSSSTDDEVSLFGPFSSPRELRSYYYFHAGVEDAARHALLMAASYSPSSAPTSLGQSEDGLGFLTSGLAKKLELVMRELREVTGEDEGADIMKEGGRMKEEDVKEEETRGGGRSALNLEGKEDAEEEMMEGSSSRPPAAGRRLGLEDLERLERRCRRDGRRSRAPPRRAAPDSSNATPPAEDVATTTSSRVDAIGVGEIVGAMRRRHLGAFSIADPDGGDGAPPPAQRADGDAGGVDGAGPDLHVGSVTHRAPIRTPARSIAEDAAVGPPAAAAAGEARRPPPPEPPQRAARYGLFANRNFEHGERVYRAGRDVLYFQDDGDWGTYLGSLLHHRDDAMMYGDDGDDDGIDAGSLLACLAAGHSSRRRVSRPGRHLIALDLNEGLFARRIRRGGVSSPEEDDYDYNVDDDDEEGNVGFVNDGSDIDWRALRDIAAGEEIVVEEGEFTIVGSFEEEDEEESMMDQGWM